jgi:hypothetical protein
MLQLPSGPELRNILHAGKQHTTQAQECSPFLRLKRKPQQYHGRNDKDDDKVYNADAYDAEGSLPRWGSRSISGMLFGAGLREEDKEE